MKTPFTVLLVLFGFLLAPALPAFAAEPPAPAALLEIPPTDDGLPGIGPIRRYDWFKDLWLARRTEWAKHVHDDQGALVFLGDSITHFWPDQASFFPGIKIANRGISGDTTRGVLIRLQQDVIALNPRAVVLLIGTNDLDEWGSPENAANNVKLILAALRDHDPRMPVILCKVMPSSLEQRRPATQVQKMNDLYAAAVADQPQVTLLDTWALFATPKGDAKPDEFPDLLHPNLVGYGKWAAALRPVLEDLRVLPIWPDEFTPEPNFTSLLNGRDLAGWHVREQPPLDGTSVTDDGAYSAVDGRIAVAVSRRTSEHRTLWTVRNYPHDFVLKLDFRAGPNARSGLIIRQTTFACNDYSLAGPFANFSAYRPLDWNELTVTVRGNLAHIVCNGEVLLDAMPVPGDGPIGLKGDRGQVEFRHIRIDEAK